MIRLAILCCAFGLFLDSLAQTDPLIDRHERINTLYSAEEYAKLIPLIDEQLQAAIGTSWEDSVHYYAYMYGRAHWKVNGVEDGLAAIKSMCDRVQERAIISHTLLALGDYSWLSYEVGDMKECLLVDSTAMVMAMKSSDIEPEQVGKLTHYMGFDHSILGNYHLAAKYFKKAVGIFEDIDPPVRLSLAESCNGVGASYWHLGRNRDAEVWYKKSLDWLGDDHSPEMITRKASAVGNLALLWEDAGDLVKAKEFYMKNLEFNGAVIENSPDPLERDEAISNRANTYANLAALYYSTGDFATSRSLLELAKADRERVHEPGTYKLIELDRRSATLERSVGNYEEAETLQRSYLAGCLMYLDNEGEYVVKALIDLAEIKIDQEEYTVADSLLIQAINLRERHHELDGDPELAKGYFLRGQVAMGMGRPEASIPLLERSKEFYTANYGMQNPKVAQCKLQLAEAHLTLGDAAMASAEIDGAIEMLTAGQLEIAQPHLIPDAHYLRARIELNNNELESALQSLEQGIESLNESRSSLQDEESRLLLAGSQQKIFDLAQDVAYQLWQDGSDEMKERLLGFSELNKTILLRDRLSTFSGLSFAGVPDSLVEQEQYLIRQMRVDPNDRSTAKNLPAFERNYQELLSKLEAEYPDYFQLKYGHDAVDLKDIQDEFLMDGQVLLVFSYTEDQLYTMLIKKGDVKLYSASSSNSKGLVAELNQAMIDREIESYLDLGHRLYKELIAPLKEDLGDSELLIIPDEDLYYLNFETLLTEPSELSTMKDHFLLNDHLISYMLSATTALQFQDLKRDGNQGALAFAPGFSDELKDEYLSSLTDSIEPDHYYLRMVQQPFAVQTAQGLSGLLNATVLTGGAAKESDFKKRASEYGVIHLGTHAEMNEHSPLYSKLVLSKEADEDGYLHAYEIYQLELNAELAVLTACETGTGKQAEAEGVRSLAHSFAYAGCPSLVMSLWKIDESTSSQIVADFYEALADGQRKNEALRNAKLQYLASADGEQALPFYWAGLVLVGDTAPLQSAGTSYWGWLAFGAVVVLLLLLVVMIRKR